VTSGSLNIFCWADAKVGSSTRATRSIKTLFTAATHTFKSSVHDIVGLTGDAVAVDRVIN
jgi:hypothetical protein